MTSTVQEFVKRIEARGQRLSEVPQPYGQSVAALVKADPYAATTLAHLLAHALHDLDIALANSQDR